MLKINSNKLKFRGKPLKECVLFLNAVQMTDGKTVKVELYPYFSKESKKDDSDRNHLRHELFYNCSKESRKDESLKGNWELLDDPEFETEGHIHFFSKNNAWELINQKTIEYLLSLGICDIEKIEEL